MVSRFVNQLQVEGKQREIFEAVDEAERVADAAGEFGVVWFAGTFGDEGGDVNARAPERVAKTEDFVAGEIVRELIG